MGRQYPIIRFNGSACTHAADASGGAADGSLHGFTTHCGLLITNGQYIETGWTGEPLCKNCRRSLRREARFIRQVQP